MYYSLKLLNYLVFKFITGDRSGEQLSRSIILLYLVNIKNLDSICKSSPIFALTNGKGNCIAYFQTFKFIIFYFLGYKIEFLSASLKRNVTPFFVSKNIFYIPRKTKFCCRKPMISFAD